MAWQSVCASEDLAEGGMMLHPRGRQEIGVFRHRGRLYAALNYCPHAGAPVCRGEIEHPVTTDGPGGRAVRAADRPALRCPWHHWEFDLESGASLCPISPRIKVYPVREKDGRIWVDL